MDESRATATDSPPRPHLGWSIFSALRLYWRDSGTDMSAAIAFYTLLSIPPLFYLASAALAWTFRDTATGDAAVTAIAGVLPAAVFDWLAGFDLGIDSSGELVIVALPALFWAANRGFSALGRAVNIAFGVRRMRADFLARAKGLVLVSAWLAFLILSVAASTATVRVNSFLIDYDRPHLSSFVENVMTHGVAPVLSFGTFVLFFRFLPYSPVTWRSAAWGALFTWVLWESARRLFGVLLSFSDSLGLVSGALAGIITFLLWVYTTVAIVLLGSEYVAVIDGHRDPRAERARDSRAAPLPGGG